MKENESKREDKKESERTRKKVKESKRERQKALDRPPHPTGESFSKL
jgi:hypothetical protein